MLAVTDENDLNLLYGGWDVIPNQWLTSIIENENFHQRESRKSGVEEGTPSRTYRLVAKDDWMKRLSV